MAQIDVDLDLLRCFVTVAALRNFTLAGDRLGRSQSAVSVRIRKLEELLETRLLDRSSRDVVLTPDGQRLLPKARAMLASGEQLVASMRRPAVSGKLRIGFLEYIAPHRIPEVLASLQRKLPDAELTFRVGLSRALISALDEREIDIAIALHDPARSDSVPLGSDQLIWVEGTKPQEERIDAPIPLCLMQAPCVYRSTALEALTKEPLPFVEIMTANSILAVHNAVASGLGISVLGTSCLGRGIRRAGSRLNLPSLPRLTLGLYGADPRKANLVEPLEEILELPS